MEQPSLFYADQYKAIPLHRIAGVTEVAERLGCAKQQVVVLRRRTDFPEPFMSVAATPLWDLNAIDLFKETWKRRGPRKTNTAVPAVETVETVEQSTDTDTDTGTDTGTQDI